MYFFLHIYANIQHPDIINVIPVVFRCTIEKVLVIHPEFSSVLQYLVFKIQHSDTIDIISIVLRHTIEKCWLFTSNFLVWYSIECNIKLKLKFNTLDIPQYRDMHMAHMVYNLTPQSGTPENSPNLGASILSSVPSPHGDEIGSDHHTGALSLSSHIGLAPILHLGGVISKRW